MSRSKARRGKGKSSEELGLTTSGGDTDLGYNMLANILYYIVLPPGGTDLAYETMYDDDNIRGTQTMPWFDPKYLAALNTQQDEEVSSSLVLTS